MKYPSFNFQLWLHTIRTIPKEVFEKIYIKRLQPDGRQLHKRRYSIQSIQGQRGGFIFHADMQALLMGHLWPRWMGDHASSGWGVFDRLAFISMTMFNLFSRWSYWCDECCHCHHSTNTTIYRDVKHTSGISDWQETSSSDIYLLTSYPRWKK